MQLHSDQLVLEVLIRFPSLLLLIAHHLLIHIVNHDLLLFVLSLHVHLLVLAILLLLPLQQLLLPPCLLSLLSLGSLDLDLLLLQDLSLHVGAHVQDMGELHTSVQLLQGEGVHVEDDTLELEDQGVREGLNYGLTLDIDTLLTGCTLVVVDSFTCN